MIVNVSDVLRERVQVLFGHQNQENPPLQSNHEHLNVWSQANLP
jgi:hypothetical protein